MYFSYAAGGRLIVCFLRSIWAYRFIKNIIQRSNHHRFLIKLKILGNYLMGRGGKVDRMVLAVNLELLVCLKRLSKIDKSRKP